MYMMESCIKRECAFVVLCGILFLSGCRGAASEPLADGVFSHLGLGLRLEPHLAKIRVNTGGGGRHTRPAPSEELPVDPPPTGDNTGPEPSDRDTDRRVLRRMLGKHYDARSMSPVRPRESLLHPNGTLVYNFKNGKPMGRIPPELRRVLNTRLPGGPSIRLRTSKRRRRKFLRFLWTYSYCPLVYRWRDLGARFWPRYFHESTCYKGRSCSIPAGLSCKPDPATTVHKTVLYWRCERKNSCKWIHVKYPMITNCKCSC